MHTSISFSSTLRCREVDHTRKWLKLTCNRTRQAAITTEILEIVGGAETLAAG